MWRKHFAFFGLALLVEPSLGARSLTQAASRLTWHSPARLHHGAGSTPGDLVFTASGIEFRSQPPFSRRWAFVEIKTFDLAPHRLVLTDYENHPHHLPGERHFRFELKEPVPPAVAAELASRVGKPGLNADPDSKAEAFFTIAARHGTRFGGTNGILRFRDQGIDYVTARPCASRSWRWADIQTIAHSDPYHLRVGGYVETFEFELKEPLPSEVFERVWDLVYSRDLNVVRKGEKHGGH